MEKLPPGTHSTKGKGGTQPNPATTRVLPDGTLVPMGKGVPSKVPRTNVCWGGGGLCVCMCVCLCVWVVL